MVAMLATVEEPTGVPWTGRFYSARELARHGVPDGAEIIHSQLLRLEMTSRQQLITKRLLLILDAAAPAGHEAIPESVWQLGESVRVARHERRGKGAGDHPRADIAVRTTAEMRETETESTHTPLLAVEVCSKNNANNDLLWKRSLYAKAGLLHYWIVEAIYWPRITMSVYEPGPHGWYVETGHWEDDYEVVIEQPFPVRFRLTDLI